MQVTPWPINCSQTPVTITSMMARSCNKSNYIQEQPEEQPEEELWDVIMCRYSIFLYSESTAESTAEEKSKRALSRLVKRLHPEGVLLLGLTDPLPQCASAILEPLPIPELLDDSCKVTSRPSTPEDFVSMLKAQNSRKLSPAWNAWRLKKHARPQTSVATQEAIANAALAAEAAEDAPRA